MDEVSMKNKSLRELNRMHNMGLLNKLDVIVGMDDNQECKEELVKGGLDNFEIQVYVDTQVLLKELELRGVYRTEVNIKLNTRLLLEELKRRGPRGFSVQVSIDTKTLLAELDMLGRKETIEPTLTINITRFQVGKNKVSCPARKTKRRKV